MASSNTNLVRPRPRASSNEKGKADLSIMGLQGTVTLIRGREDAEVVVLVKHPTLPKNFMEARLVNIAVLRRALLSRSLRLSSAMINTIDELLDPTDYLSLFDAVNVDIKQDSKKNWLVTAIRLTINKSRPNHYSQVNHYINRKRPKCWPIPHSCPKVPALHRGDLVLATSDVLRRCSCLPINILFLVMERDKPEGKSMPGAASIGTYCQDEQSFLSFLCSVPQYFAVDNRSRVSMHQGLTNETFREAISARCRSFPILQRNFSLNDVRIICTVRDAFSVLNPLLNKAEKQWSQGHDPGLVVGLDCEGVNLGATGQLTLVQISTMAGQVYIFDVLQCPSVFREGRLTDLLESNAVTKVIQDCTQDAAALFHQYQITLTNIFDTSIAYMVLQDQCCVDRPRPRIGLPALCEVVGEDPPDHKNKKFKKKMIYTANFWARRPLQPDMVNYAASDVYLLLPNIYNALNRLIHPNWRNIFTALCNDTIRKQMIDAPK